jgi:threonylcarbamoyladenosine tRNA methylthiotransferase MtaB
MDVYLDALGCRLNEAEVESWARALAAGGHRVVGAPERAQVMLLNTCAVTAEAAKKSRQQVRRLHRQNPGARLAVTGCYAELEPARVAELAGVDLVIGNRDKERAAELLAALDPHVMPALAAAPDDDHVHRAARTRAFIKVQDGCRNRCAFCIVTVARGEERSRPVAAVVDEIGALAAAGYREAVLTGVHLGGYGSDLGTDLAALVEAVLRDTDIARLRLSSLEPWDLPREFWRLWASPRLMPHLHLPLQSGCDTVLRRMARRCSTEEYAALVAAARAAIPSLTVTTDVIVGYPGETDAEHRATVDFVRRVGFGHIHVFAYSPRAGTGAARMRGQVSPDAKRARSRELHDVAARMRADTLSAAIGQTRDVLWEGDCEPTPDRRERWRGYTDNYLRVETVAPLHRDLENAIIPTRLEQLGAASDGHLPDRIVGVAVIDGSSASHRAPLAAGPRRSPALRSTAG